MLNKIWFGLLLIGILYALGRGTCNAIWPPQQTAASEQSHAPPASDRDLLQMGKDLNEAALSAATVSIEICIGLIGIMALWLGLLAVARDAGLVDALARLLSPVMCWLFPEVPAGHPAQGAMLMNISANMLNLDNAATPLGLKAMQELQTLNPNPETATNSMAMFMAINTSNVTLIPFTIIGYRALSGSDNPAEPTLGILLVTSISTVVAIVVTRLLARSPRYALASAGKGALASAGKGALASARKSDLASAGPNQDSAGEFTTGRPEDAAVNSTRDATDASTRNSNADSTEGEP